MHPCTGAHITVSWVDIARLQIQEPTLTTKAYVDHRADEQDIRVVVRQGDFEAALRDLTPSVTEQELLKYEAIRAGIEGNATVNVVNPLTLDLSSPKR